MHYIADLHLHSKYSRAVSKNMILPIMADYARLKGIDILTASDFTHTLWFKEAQAQLEEAGEGIYRLRSEISNSKFPISNNQKDILFLLSTEISSIYKQGEKLRRIHNLVFVPSFEAADKLNKELLKRGCNLSADGRPIIGLSSRNLLEMLLSIDERSLLIPCHVWTPHFGVYGSKSGFDSLEEAFGDLEQYVYGIETGISSDPEMNWRIPELRNRSILSFSDAHNPANMARETVAFELSEPTYANIRNAIMRKGGASNRIAYTIEFYPEEGKYHYSGHRNCKVSLSPLGVRERGTICPVCSHEVTEGVELRIEQLGGAELAKVYKEKISDSGIKWYTDQTKNHPPYVKLVRFEQVIAAGLGVTVASQRVSEMYKKLVTDTSSELDILLKEPIANLARIAGERIAEALRRVREGQVKIEPGYDGQYGKVEIWGEGSADQNFAGKNDDKQLAFDI